MTKIRSGLMQGSRQLRSFVWTALVSVVLIVAAPAAHALTTFLPWPGAAACTSAFAAEANNWRLNRLVVNSTATISTATALVTQDPTTRTTAIQIRANDASVGTGAWTLLGTLSQASHEPTGLAHTVTYSGAVTLTPGTYWIGVRTTAGPNTLICALDPDPTPTTTPWTIASVTEPWAYATGDNGASFTSLTRATAGRPAIPFISLTGTALTTDSIAGPLQPQTFELSLTTGTDFRCSGELVVAATSTWVRLPAANDCTSVVNRHESMLLGWSTSSSFPVDVARNQVAKGWGNIDGQYGNQRMIFIPAGGYAQVSGDNTLFAIFG